MAEMTQSGRWLTRRVLGWALFDVASSTYIALVPTFFGLYFTTVVAGGRPSANAWWGATAAASLLLAGILAPIVGAHADRSGRWLRAVAVTTALCALAAVLLSLGQKAQAVAEAREVLLDLPNNIMAQGRNLPVFLGGKPL